MVYELFLWMSLAVPLLFNAIIKRSDGKAQRPPGPRPLPIIENLLDVRGGNLHHYLASLAHDHGPVMMLKLGLVTTVFISSRDAAWEAFTKHDRLLAARTVPDTRRALAHSERSMVWLPSYHPLWKTLRGVAACHIFSPRNLNVARSTRERKVYDMVDYIRRCAGREVDIGQILYHGMFDLLANVLFSENAHPNLSELMEDMVALLAKPNMSDLFPLLRPLDLQGFRHWTAMHMRRVFHILDNIVDCRLAQVTDDKCKDVLDSLLVLMSTSKLTRQDCEGMSAEKLDVTERYTSNSVLVMAAPLKVVPVVGT
ncbi:hypothetical protein E2562_031850 [Oryza meyeriana var. granulata]|uniref:Cytochrome P450 n=1 Tax=Oryza meyeriana var. granulata TaxID=110450 RepID=A0A6G1C0H6_9ORYZ|nr:hypothetical protein E2562_031850 [Oryza meyeriana var. granulata]